jgi:hypothetical protein
MSVLFVLILPCHFLFALYRYDPEQDYIMQRVSGQTQNLMLATHVAPYIVTTVPAQS